ncbi:hypothetical protein [Moorena sp. SIOASIH]|uniref:hypothetical protein n=1 Tax=Moorena sp. SIOASIH TaxID=2607817 RepID=UPI0025E7D631|nr:hypothetical protein [Moorena sp. SIOASIH]
MSGVVTGFNSIVENPVITMLFFAAAGLLVVVSGGIIYLTAAEWRDRRRKQRDK